MKPPCDNGTHRLINPLFAVSPGLFITHVPDFEPQLTPPLPMGKTRHPLRFLPSSSFLTEYASKKQKFHADFRQLTASITLHRTPLCTQVSS